MDDKECQAAILKELTGRIGETRAKLDNLSWGLDMIGEDLQLLLNRLAKTRSR